MTGHKPTGYELVLFKITEQTMHSQGASSVRMWRARSWREASRIIRRHHLPGHHFTIAPIYGPLA